MRFDLSNYRTDKDAKANGVWVEFGFEAAFKIASFDSPSFTEAFRKELKPYQELGRKATEDEQVKIMVGCMARHIVLDWRGIFDNDEPISYSVEAAEKLLTELDWLRERIVSEARSLENFKAQVRKETEGN